MRRASVFQELRNSVRKTFLCNRPQRERREPGFSCQAFRRRSIS
jgi:hypothetical protein